MKESVIVSECSDIWLTTSQSTVQLSEWIRLLCELENLDFMEPEVNTVLGDHGGRRTIWTTKKYAIRGKLHRLHFPYKPPTVQKITANKFVIVPLLEKKSSFCGDKNIWNTYDVSKRMKLGLTKDTQSQQYGRIEVVQEKWSTGMTAEVLET